MRPSVYLRATASALLLTGLGACGGDPPAATPDALPPSDAATDVAPDVVPDAAGGETGADVVVLDQPDASSPPDVAPPPDASPPDVAVGPDTPPDVGIDAERDVATEDIPPGMDRPTVTDTRPTVDGPSICGDGVCSGAESCGTCPGDCGVCTSDLCDGLSCQDCVTTPGCLFCGDSRRRCARAALVRPDTGLFCSDVVGMLGICDVRFPDLTRPCTTSDGNPSVNRRCGWVRFPEQRCTAGQTVLVGCTSAMPAADGGSRPECGTPLGSCIGDPMIRVCATEDCAVGRTTMDVTLNPGASTTLLNDSCGRCPLAPVRCPASGRLIVLAAQGAAGSDPWMCTPAIRPVP